MQLLVGTMDLTASAATAGTFPDAEPGAWYERALATAKALGIAQGKPDGTFGVNDPITRQDAAVMLYRAGLLKKALQASGGEANFTDADDIAQYAAEAVAAVQQAGWMQGFSDGRYAPLNLTTRAESAVIMHRLLQSLQQ